MAWRFVSRWAYRPIVYYIFILTSYSLWSVADIPVWGLGRNALYVAGRIPVFLICLVVYANGVS